MLIFEQSLSFVVKPKSLRHVQSLLSSSTADESFDVSRAVSHVSSARRRFLVMSPIVASFGIIVTNFGNDEAFAADGTLDRIVGQLKEASRMLDTVPDLIKAEKWDSGECYNFIQSITGGIDTPRFHDHLFQIFHTYIQSELS